MVTEEQMRHLWWQIGVIYQIYPRSYQDSNNDGIGDIPGIVQRLDYLKDTLGVDAIWLSPFYPSPMADFGYDVSDYCDVDPMFGTLADFDRLVEEAHARSINVVIDFVPNHTSDRHPWFIESRSSRDNPKRDWYVWRDAKPDGSLPNNWQSNFGGSSWEWDQHTGQYYLHSFLKEQPDLNWRNPEVKQAMFDAVRFWLKRGVDGFRLDVAHYIAKDPDLRDNPPNPDYGKDPNRLHVEYDKYLHLYDKGHPDVHPMFAEFRAILDEFSRERPRYSVGEIHILNWQEWSKYYGANNNELHMPFNFALLMSPYRADVVRAIVDGLEAALPEGAWPNYVMGNHDETRLATRVGLDLARQVAVLLLSLRGTPTLYQGDELGMLNVAIPPEKEQDPFGIRVPGKGRDGCRTPMQWSAGANAGFSAPGVETWLPLAPDYQQVNVEIELQDPTSFLNLYRSMLAFRRQSMALQAGSYRPVDGTPPSTYAFLREFGTQKLLVALNFSAREKTLALAELGSGQVKISSLMDRSGAVDLSALELRPFEGLVIEL